MCSLQPAIARCSETLPCPHKESNGEWRTEQLPRKSIRGIVIFKLAPTVPPAISEVGQVCETETAKTSSDYCCCACCTVHVHRGDLRELLDILLDSHSIA